MLIKYIDDKDAIWTFGYPFMNQFLMIFNMEEKHVGIKKLKKTSFPIINLVKDWEKWNEKEEKSCSIFRIIAIITLIIIVFAIIFLIYRYIRKKSLDSNGPAFDVGNNNDNIY